jgi:hypothetical protein
LGGEQKMGCERSQPFLFLIVKDLWCYIVRLMLNASRLQVDQVDQVEQLDQVDQVCSGAGVA